MAIEEWNGELPERMAALPRDKHGRPVPWFVAFIDGEPDFRIIAPGRIRDAVRGSLCWVCGRGFGGGEDRAWLIGPMCAVNRITAEPPSHKACAVFSARNCPFLINPGMVRRARRLPEGVREPAGVMIRRNPGVALVWITRYRDWHIVPDGKGVLFSIGPAKRALWFAEGRDATRQEVLASIDSGLPLLREMAVQDGMDAITQLDRMYADALAYLPE
jgi:hypothetical protein